MQRHRPYRVGLLAMFLCPLVRSDPSAAGEPNASKPPAAAAQVAGLVTYDGPLPPPVAVSEAATVRRLVEVDGTTKGLKEAVVWLEGAKAPAHRAVPAEPAIIDQRNFVFVPHTLAIEAGRPVEFRNSDLANHGVTAAALEPKNRFNVMVPFGERYVHRFGASARPLAIGCPVHGSMSAWIFVFDHPYFAVTDARGQFRISGVPPGRYHLHVRHVDGGMERVRAIGVGSSAADVRVEFHAADLKVGGAAAPSDQAEGGGPPRQKN